MNSYILVNTVHRTIKGCKYSGANEENRPRMIYDMGLTAWGLVTAGSLSTTAAGTITS